MSGDRPLWMLGAQELLQGYRSGTFSPPDVLDSILDRADRINPIINAIVTVDRARARAAARASAQRWRQKETLGSLDGVPLTVKDNIHVKGLRATWGSRLFAEHIVAEDELPVERVRGETRNGTCASITS